MVRPGLLGYLPGTSTGSWEPCNCIGSYSKWLLWSASSNTFNAYFTYLRLEICSSTERTPQTTWDITCFSYLYLGVTGHHLDCSCNRRASDVFLRPVSFSPGYFHFPWLFRIYWVEIALKLNYIQRLYVKSWMVPNKLSLTELCGMRVPYTPFNRGWVGAGSSLVCVS